MTQDSAPNRPSTRDRFNGAAPGRARNELRLALDAIVRQMLQRGRARAGAECGLQQWSHSRGARFNGAAPARARNGRRWWEPGGGRHCFNGAAPARARNGLGRKLQGIDSLRAASTGPRPRGRGMQASPARGEERGELLQRGRARAGAECGASLQEDEAEILGFNGAAPARARNGRCCQTWLRSTVVASTGPRPRGRGMVPNWNGR